LTGRRSIGWLVRAAGVGISRAAMLTARHVHDKRSRRRLPPDGEERRFAAVHTAEATCTA